MKNPGNPGPRLMASLTVHRSPWQVSRCRFSQRHHLTSLQPSQARLSPLIGSLAYTFLGRPVNKLSQDLLVQMSSSQCSEFCASADITLLLPYPHLPDGSDLLVDKVEILGQTFVSLLLCACRVHVRMLLPQRQGWSLRSPEACSPAMRPDTEESEGPWVSMVAATMILLPKE